MASFGDFARRLAGFASGTAAREAGEHRAAVAMILRLANARPEVLLMKRVEHPRDRWSGQISLPGGHQSAADGDLLATARRETLEEVGVDLDGTTHLLGTLPPVQAKARGRVLDMAITPYVFAIPPQALPTASAEAEEAFWFPLGSAAGGELDSLYRYEGPRGARELPCWRFEGRVVWGLTHEMLSGLLRVIAPDGIFES